MSSPRSSRGGWWFTAGLLAGGVGLGAVWWAGAAGVFRGTTASAPDLAGAAQRSEAWRPPPLLSREAAAAQVAGWLAASAVPAPEAAASATVSEVARAQELRLLALRLPEAELGALVGQLAGRKGPGERRLFQVAFGLWMERAPAAAAKWLDASGAGAALDGDTRYRLREELGLSWVGQDPGAALAWAHASAEGGGPWGMRARMYGRLAEADPARAWALASARDDAFLKDGAHLLFDAWAKQDPVAALDAMATRLVKAGASTAVLASGLSAWAGRDPLATLHWVDQWTREMAGDLPNPELNKHVLQQLAYASTDQPARLADAIIKKEGAGGVGVLEDMLRNWISRDSPAATAWLTGLADPGLRATLLERSTRVYYTNEPQAGLPLVQLLPPGPTRDARLTQQLQAWAKIDASAALAWLAQHDEPGAAAAVRSTVLGVIARDEPQTAVAEWAKLTEPTERRAALEEIADAWSRHDPAAAATWLATAEKAVSGPPQQHWEGGWPKVMEQWMKTDPAAAPAWIDAQADPDLRRVALRAFAWRAGDMMDRAQAADLIAGTTDVSARSQALLMLVGMWKGLDPTGAAAWVEQSTIPPEEKQALRRIMVR